MVTPRQFRDMAMDAYNMDRQSKDDEWQNESRDRQRKQWGMMDNLVGGLDDPLAQAFPEQYAEMQFNQKYGAPEPPTVKTYRDGNQEVTVQWDGRGWQEIDLGALARYEPFLAIAA